MKKYYSDFIGEEIVHTMHVTGLFAYNCPSEILKKRLSKLIDQQLNYKNGLLCSFSSVKVECAEGNEVRISGIVTKCEVDCG